MEKIRAFSDIEKLEEAHLINSIYDEIVEYNTEHGWKTSSVLDDAFAINSMYNRVVNEEMIKNALEKAKGIALSRAIFTFQNEKYGGYFSESCPSEPEE